jgi:hypothetical protein
MSTTNAQDKANPPPPSTDDEDLGLPLTHEEKLWAFRQATNSIENARARWLERAESGMSDSDLAQALEYELGIFGGRYGPNGLSLIYKGNGLKIWVGRGSARSDGPPVYAGALSIAMAREMYGIKEPGDTQMSLL